MPQSRRAHSRARAGCRGLARVPLLAVVVLVLSVLLAPMASAAPAAHAQPASGPRLRDLGQGRQIDLELHPSGGVPDHLSLAHAKFELTSGGTTATCETDEDGVCTIQYLAHGASDRAGTSLDLRGGTYSVMQVAGVAGLQQSSGVLGTITVCDCWHTILWVVPVADHADVTISNTSQYRGTIVATVVDAATHQPVRNAIYRLSGPGYPITHSYPAVPEVNGGTDQTGRDGRLVFGSHVLNAPTFRPGTWTLEPVDVPARYAAVTVTVDLLSTDPAGSTWTLPTVQLAKAVTQPDPPSIPTTTASTTASTTSASPTTETTSASPTTETTSASPTTAETTSASPTTATTSAAATTTDGTGDPNGVANVGTVDTAGPTPADAATTTTATSTVTSTTSAAAPVSPSAAVPPARVGTTRVGTVGQAQQQVPAASASSSAVAALPSAASTSSTGGVGPGDLVDTSAAEQPDLKTVSSTIGESGLIGIGIAFVALVVGLFFLVRWRTRRG